MAAGKSRCFRASNRRPLPIMSALRAPESWPSTLRREISQGIARRRAGYLCVDEKENQRATPMTPSSIGDRAGDTIQDAERHGMARSARSGFDAAALTQVRALGARLLPEQPPDVLGIP